jgi:hypothetical protein
VECFVSLQNSFAGDRAAEKIHVNQETGIDVPQHIPNVVTTGGKPRRACLSKREEPITGSQDAQFRDMATWEPSKDTDILKAACISRSKRGTGGAKR